MRLLLPILILLCPFACLAQSETMGLTVTADTLCALLSWDDEPTGQADHYIVYRLMPNEMHFDSIDTTHATTMRHCIGRQTCGDTVLFRIVALSATDSVIAISTTAGDAFDDPSPTTACRPNCVTVDSAGQHILLSWHPSPDADIMGYYICSGNPCMEYDTVWGRLDTSYICLDHDARQQHSYRVLAFDSCYRASPLTPYLNNLVLNASTTPCGRSATLSWCHYDNMPSGLRGYAIQVCYADTVAISDTVGDTTLNYTFDAPDSINGFSATVTALSADSNITAASNRIVIPFDIIDTALFLSITHCQYDILEGAIVVEGLVDSSYQTDYYTLYRSTSHGNAVPIARLTADSIGRVSFADYDINLLQSSRYTYIIGSHDRCGLREKMSDSVTADIPPANTRGAIFPNIITPKADNNQTLCPSLRLVDRDVYDLYIYNRMGLLVFHTSNPKECWDATRNGTPLPQGTYTYILHIGYIDTTVETIQGTITIVY